MRGFAFGLVTGIALVAGLGAGYRAGYSTGVAAADSVLAVSKAGVSLLRVNSDGKVGIGTIDPQAKLHVTGGARFDGTVNSTSGGFQYPDGLTRSVAPQLFLRHIIVDANDVIVGCQAGEIVLMAAWEGNGEPTTNAAVSASIWHLATTGTFSGISLLCAKGVQ